MAADVKACPRDNKYNTPDFYNCERSEAVSQYGISLKKSEDRQALPSTRDDDN